MRNDATWHHLHRIPVRTNLTKVDFATYVFQSHKIGHRILMSIFQLALLPHNFSVYISFFETRYVLKNNSFFFALSVWQSLFCSFIIHCWVWLWNSRSIPYMEQRRRGLCVVTRPSEKGKWCRSQRIKSKVYRIIVVLFTPT